MARYSLLIMLLFAAFQTSFASDCNLSNLEQLEKVDINTLKKESGSILIDKENEVFGDINRYYDKSRLKKFDVLTKTEHGYSDLSFWVYNKNSYIVRYIKGFYINIDVSRDAKVAGNFFYICDGKLIGKKKIKDIDEIPYPNIYLEDSKDVYKKIMK